jgi:glycosyltransferase involved in cell wall biosynthesis
MGLSKLLTIVIPCKNEKDIISKTLDLLNYQKHITGVKVIVCDSSDDGFTKKSIMNRIKSKTDLYDLQLIEGGLPAKARNNGAKLVETPYVLFMDADIFILNYGLLFNTTYSIVMNEQDLLTCKIRSSEGDYNYVFKFFDIIQWISKYTTPFCLGGFMFVKKTRFDEIGGFDEDVKVAEDYLFSKKIKSSKFGISKLTIFTSPRRFKSKGLWYMLKLMISSLFNNNNKKHFKDDKGYWI